MAEKTNRMIGVMQRGGEIMIVLSWVEPYDGGVIPVKSTLIEFPVGLHVDSLQKALRILAPVWSIAFFGDEGLAAFSERVTEQVEKFDLVADADEPGQALISRYVIG